VARPRPVRARWPFAFAPSPLLPALLALVCLTVGLCGCGGVSPAADDKVGDQLTIYSSLPLQGPDGAISRQIVAGEKLALADDGGRVGRLTVSFVSLDDSNPTTGQWDPGVTAANARAAAHDPTTIAYIGDFNSGATAISLPLMNAAGILQVSPASPYIGLTASLDAGEDEPERFYPTSLRTFGRIAPGDQVQAAAQVATMRRLGVRRLYVIADQDQFDVPLAQIVAAMARKAGLSLVGQDTLDTQGAGQSYAAEVAKVAQARPDGVFLSGVATLGAARLFRQLHAWMPQLRLLGSSSLSNPLFTEQLGAAAGVTTLGAPVLPLAMYPTSAKRVAAQYEAHFGAGAGAYVLYGYEAMSVVLSAIREAGRHGDERKAVIGRFFATHARRSVIGEYSIEPSGETTLASYGIDRVVDGRATFWRALSG
jgi:branched-chain amino acid transport system substrate-binding protein